MLRNVKIFAVFVLVWLVSFVGTGLAASAVAPSSDDGTLLELLKPVYEAFAHGQKLYAGMLALVALVALAKRYLAPRVKFLQTDAGGAAMALVGSFGAAMAASLAGGMGVSFAMVKTAIWVAVGAAGGYSLVKKLVVDPVLRPLAKLAPAWMQPIFYVIFWAFDRPTPVEQAEADGASAVAAHPGGGLDAVTGKPEDVS